MLAKYLKEKRESANLSQNDVAEVLGYQTAQFISNWERGLSVPPIESLQKISKIYKVSKDEVKQKYYEEKLNKFTEDLQKKLGI